VPASVRLQEGRRQNMKTLIAAVLAAFAGTSSVTSGSTGEVAVTVDGDGFSPSRVTVPKGAEVRLVFTRTTDATCAKAVAFPELGITKDLPLKEPVAIVVAGAKAGTYTFQCGMGMYESKLVIE
jgi:plastocyanin domain-containing protein